MIKEAIILAGGLGTRLRDTVPDVPKCMAPINGVPFLFYVINYLRSQGIEKFIFSIGYKHEVITEYLEKEFPTLNYSTVVEEAPMGTGGAIKLAINIAIDRHVVIVNGDTLFKGDLRAAAAAHYDKNAECTMLIKPMKDFDRYGTVITDAENRVIGFAEKKFIQEGNINAGMYLINAGNFRSEKFPAKFSFEKDYLEAMFADRRFFGLVMDNYFIDIGVPEDYARVQAELSQPPFDLKAIDNSWTIFIDRDGVINHEKKDDYIRNWREFVFYDGVREVFPALNKKFGKVIIVSNQRGVGRELMTETELAGIHRHMEKQITGSNGKIDGIYYCTSTDTKHPERKPNPGMAFRSLEDFPAIDLSRSVMIGNKLSDMKFGRNAGMYTIFIATTHPETSFPHPDIDARFNSLPDFVKAL